MFFLEWCRCYIFKSAKKTQLLWCTNSGSTRSRTCTVEVLWIIWLVLICEAVVRVCLAEVTYLCLGEPESRGLHRRSKDTTRTAPGVLLAAPGEMHVGRKLQSAVPRSILLKIFLVNPWIGLSRGTTADQFAFNTVKFQRCIA